MTKDVREFVASRLTELHSSVFSTSPRLPLEAIKRDRLAYRAYHKFWNDNGLGRDVSNLPQLQLPII